MARRRAREDTSKQLGSEGAQRLRETAGSSQAANGFRLDGTLLAITVQLLSRSGAALQVGVSMDKAQLVIKIYDGEFPITKRFEEEWEADEYLKRVCLAYVPREPMSDGLRQWLEAYEIQKV